MKNMSIGPYITSLDFVILLNILNLFIVVEHHGGNEINFINCRTK